MKHLFILIKFKSKTKVMLILYTTDYLIVWNFLTRAKLGFCCNTMLDLFFDSSPYIVGVHYIVNETTPPTNQPNDHRSASYFFVNFINVNVMKC